MENFKRVLPSLIFNVAETAIIVLMGVLMKLPIAYIILVMLAFMITRGFCSWTFHRRRHENYG